VSVQPNAFLTVASSLFDFLGDVKSFVEAWLTVLDFLKRWKRIGQVEARQQAEHEQEGRGVVVTMTTF